MAVPNEKLRARREAMPSGKAPGECMSRRELAEAVNDYLWESTKARYELDSHSIARWERGEVLWPSAPYRSANSVHLQIFRNFAGYVSHSASMRQALHPPERPFTDWPAFAVRCTALGLGPPSSGQPLAERRGAWHDDVMESAADRFATPRLAAGALFVKREKVLLARKTYGNRWDIPGGYVDRGESPTFACERELREELGLHRTVRRLLVHDWAPSESEGDKILYVFDCGVLGDDEQRAQLDGVEIDHVEWVAVDDLSKYVIPRLERRLVHAHRAYTSGVTLYLEHGQLRN